MQLDNRTKQLLRELGRAINDAVSDSDRIAGIISKIKTRGFDVFLMLDAIVALNQQEMEGESDKDSSQIDQRFLKSLKIRVNSSRKKRNSAGESSKDLEITPQDLKFLKSLKIDVDDLS